VRVIRHVKVVRCVRVIKYVKALSCVRFIRYVKVVRCLEKHGVHKVRREGLKVRESH
jgi:hypothetical protein